MSAPDRAYDPKRRPNTFYKNDPKSDRELKNRAVDRNQLLGQSPSTPSEHVEFGIRNDIPMNQATVSKDGKKLENISIYDHESGTLVTGGTSRNIPISGTNIGKKRK